MKEWTPSRMAIAEGPSRAAAIALIHSSGLPTDDLTDATLDHFFFAGAAEQPVGIVGLEIYGRDALLRSLVVALPHRSIGLGTALVDRAETYAAGRGVRTVYLLTMTAEAFFARRGYVRASRDEAPPAILATAEFSSLCPASSVFMWKRIG
jgi:amino-acid N-acetyltransferase